MATQVTPGSKITVKVVKKPTNEAASKTIVRLLSKDRGVRTVAARHKKGRKNNFRQAARGGRLWNIRVVKQTAVTASVGSTGTIVASLDVLTDLKSVAKFVEVTAA